MILSNTDQKYYTDDLKETEGRFLGIARVFIETEGNSLLRHSVIISSTQTKDVDTRVFIETCSVHCNVSLLFVLCFRSFSRDKFIYFCFVKCAQSDSIKFT